jgi:hypothetical protein
MTQPLPELTFPDNTWPYRAPRTYVFVAPADRVPETVADVLPRAKRMRVWASVSDENTAASTSAIAPFTRVLFIFLLC